MNGKIISFGEGAEMLYDKALKCIDEGETLRAASYLKKCMEMEPDNAAYATELAVLYSRSEQYERSNEIIARCLLDRPDMPPEVYVAMGVNAAAAGNADGARDLLERYLDLTDDNGPYAEDAEMMLDAIEEYGYDDVTMQTVTVPGLTMKGNQALEDGRIREAMTLYEQSDAETPDRPETLLPMALTYFGCGMSERGMAVLERLVRLDPHNVDALCHYVLFANRCGLKGPEYEKRLTYLKKYRGEEPDPLRRILLVLCDLGEHEAVLRLARRLVVLRPYDEAAHHFVAAALYRTGKIPAALEEWSLTDNLADGSVVARYYLGKYKEPGTEEPVPPMYVYQLPYADMMLLYRRTVENYEKNEPLTEEMCLFTKWMLAYAAPEEKMLFLMRAAVCDDDRLRRILQGYLLSENETDEIRAFGAGLICSHERGDVYICQGGIPELYSDCRRPEFDVYVDALTLCCERMRGRYRDFHRALLRLFRLMLEHDESAARPRSARAVAAAMEYIVATFTEQKTAPSELAALYGTTVRSMRNRVNRILHQAEQEKEQEHETD